MKRELAPILLFVYNRPQHVRQLVTSLLANEEAAQSTLYVYADGAKDENDQAAVEEVRQIILDLDGFKTVHLIQREENWGLAEVIDG